MAARRTPWTRKPPMSVGIDWGRAPGLHCVIPFGEGCGPPVARGVYGDVRGTVTGSPTWAGDGSSALATPAGYFPGSAYWDFGNSYGNLGSQWTILLWFRADAAATDIPLSKGAYGTAGAWYLQAYDTADLPVVSSTVLGSYIWTVTYSRAGAWLCHGLVGATGTAATAYTQGIANAGAGTVAVPNDLGTAAYPLRVGAYADGSNSFAGSVGWVELWSRQLSAQEMWLRYLRPLDLFQPRRRAWVGFSTGAAPSFSPAWISRQPVIGSGVY